MDALISYFDYYQPSNAYECTDLDTQRDQERLTR